MDLGRGWEYAFLAPAPKPSLPYWIPNGGNHWFKSMASPVGENTAPLSSVSANVWVEHRVTVGKRKSVWTEPRGLKCRTRNLAWSPSETHLHLISMHLDAPKSSLPLSQVQQAKLQDGVPQTVERPILPHC